MDRNDNICVNTTSNYGDEVPLYVSLGPSTNLLEFRDPMSKVANTGNLRKNREAEINFPVTQSKPAPADVMIPAFSVPVMKWFRS